MLFNKTFKLLLCLLIIFPLVQAPQIKASEVYDHEALLQYKGYGQAMYETIVDQTSFVSGQYTDNKEYVSQSINEIRDYANFWLNEQGNLNTACGGLNLFTSNCLGELVVSAGGYALTVGDVIKNLFNDYEIKSNEIPIGMPNVSIDPSQFTLISNDKSAQTYVIDINSGKLKINDATYNAGRRLNLMVMAHIASDIKQMALYLDNYKFTYRNYGAFNNNYVEFNSWRDGIYAEFPTSDIVSIFNYLSAVTGASFISINNNNEPSIPPITKPTTIINNYIKESAPVVSIPKPKAYLTCPDDIKIEMAINGSTFLDVNGNVMNVNTDGTAEISSQVCNLGWEKQQVQYIDDTAAITDSKGNWLDVLTGELLLCVLDDNCVPAVPPVEEVEPEPLDNTLLLYVKNAYDYATQVLKTGTDGLKSLAQGAKDLTSLFGIFFSWLPNEFVVLMTSGLGIAIGLRLFRK